jgi:hypothetical protein
VGHVLLAAIAIRINLAEMRVAAEVGRIGRGPEGPPR